MLIDLTEFQKMNPALVEDMRRRIERFPLSFRFLASAGSC